MKSTRSCGARAWMTSAAMHPGIVPITRYVPFRIDAPAVGSAITATDQPAQYGFIHPAHRAIPYTRAKANPVLIASFSFVMLLILQSLVLA